MSQNYNLTLGLKLILMGPIDIIDIMKIPKVANSLSFNYKPFSVQCVCFDKKTSICLHSSHQLIVFKKQVMTNYSSIQAKGGDNQTIYNYSR